MTALSETVGRMVAESPARARLLEDAGIDYCLGEQTLAEACERGGVDPESLLDQLEALDRNQDSAVRNWSEITLSALCDAIVHEFHDSLREELPRIGLLLCRVAEGDSARHPELNRILELFSLFSGDLKLHMTKEEETVFPLIRKLESRREACSDLTEMVARLELEHASAVRSLDNMREWTHDFCPPGDACGAYRAVLDALQALERNLRDHFSVENNVLFPRVFQLQFVGTS
jgi:regulator of cell morphogenesis and NO signaling